MEPLALKLLLIGHKCEMKDLMKWTEYFVGQNLTLGTFCESMLAAEKCKYVCVCLFII
jgi:hypothetical protein